MQEEAKTLYLLREELEQAEAELAEADNEAIRVLQEHAPDVWLRKQAAQTRQEGLKRRAEDARKAFAAVVAAQVTAEEQYGRGKVHPCATVVHKTTVIPNMQYAPKIAEFLLTLGLVDSIVFKFEPIATFKALPAALIPTVDDVPILAIQLSPETKIDSHKVWKEKGIVFEAALATDTAEDVPGDASDDNAPPF